MFPFDISKLTCKFNSYGCITFVTGIEYLFYKMYTSNKIYLKINILYIFI